MKIKKAIKKLKLSIKLANSLKYKDPVKEQERVYMLEKSRDLLKKLEKMDPEEELK